MSTSTITSYHQVSRDELATLSPDTGARIAVTTDDQSYEMYVSDGTRWIKMGNTRTDGISYILPESGSAPATTVSHTPEYHFDAAQGAASTHMFSDLDGTSVSNGDNVCEWKSLTGGHSLVQLDASRQPRWTNGGTDPDGMYGVHMHGLGVGMNTTEKNNKQSVVNTVTFVVYKPTAENISDLYRDVNELNARSPIGDHYINVLSSNRYSPRANGSDIRLFFYNSSHHFYTYATNTYNWYNSLPRNGDTTTVDGVSRTDAYNDTFVDNRQLAVIVTHNPGVENRGLTRHSSGYINMSNTYYNVDARPANQSTLIRNDNSSISYNPKYDGLCIGSGLINNQNPHCIMNETLIFNNVLSHQDINAIASHLALKWNIPNVHSIGKDINTYYPQSFYNL